MGDVIEKSLLVTRIRTIKNVDIIIPNSSPLTGTIINYSTSSNAAGLIYIVRLRLEDVPTAKST